MCYTVAAFLHYNPLKQKCYHCGKEFDTERGAEIHERRYCKHIKNIKCASCSKLFTEKQFEKHTCDTVLLQMVVHVVVEILMNLVDILWKIVC